jgi:RNA polymerase sigma-70 factor (ECF subfamily)
LEALQQDQHFNLVVECRNGNKKAQYELYRLYSRGMYNVAMRILANEDEAADVLQESFLDAFLRISDFRNESTFGWWIKQIIVNKSISSLRKRRVEFVSLDDEKVESLADEDSDDEEEIQYRVEQVKKAILLLPDNYRIVLSLFLLEGYDHEEIAHILKISENLSRTQLLRAKRKLIQLLKDKD